MSPRVIVVEYTTRADDNTWTTRETDGPYPGEGFLVGPVGTVTRWIARNLAAWLNDRDG